MNFSKLPIMGAIFIALISCTNNSGGESKDKAIVLSQLNKDFAGQGTISDFKLLESKGYVVADFKLTSTSSASISRDMTAWYELSADTAKIVMDTEDLGINIPERLSVAFNKSKYANAQWNVEEVELDSRYTDGQKSGTYEIELKNVAKPELEAKLYYDATTFALLFEKESFDNEETDDNDKIVINHDILSAVNSLYPTAIVIAAEFENDFIEVDATITDETGLASEIEIMLNLDYSVASTEVEIETTYGHLPTKVLTSLNAWFSKNPKLAPQPQASASVSLSTVSVGTVVTYRVDVECIVDGDDKDIDFSLDTTYKVVSYEID